MLGKLLKVEMKAMGRVLLPLYLLLFISGVGLSLSLRHEDMLTSLHLPGVVLITIFAILVVVAIVIVMIMTVVLVVQRFYRNLLGNEGYLMFSLPASTGQHILAKALSALVWITLSLVVGFLLALLTGTLMGEMPEMIEQAKLAWNHLIDSYTREKIVRYTILGVILFVASILKQVGLVYAAIAIGHQWSNHRMAGSVLAYFGLSILEGAFLSLFQHGQDVVFSYMDGVIEFGATGGLFIFIGLRVLLIVIYTLVAWYLLDRRLNLE